MEELIIDGRKELSITIQNKSKINVENNCYLLPGTIGIICHVQYFQTLHVMYVLRVTHDITYMSHTYIHDMMYVMSCM
jgi:hypothetical protein